MGSRSIGGLLTLLSCLLHQNTSTNAFVPQHNRVAFDTVSGFKNIIQQSTGSKLYGKWESYDPSDDNPCYEDALARNKARTDVRNFLTQRAIQSFICLLDHCRDPHTVAWVEVSVCCRLYFFFRHKTRILVEKPLPEAHESVHAVKNHKPPNICHRQMVN